MSGIVSNCCASHTQFWRQKHSWIGEWQCSTCWESEKHVHFQYFCLLSSMFYYTSILIIFLNVLYKYRWKIIRSLSLLGIQWVQLPEARGIECFCGDSAKPSLHWYCGDDSCSSGTIVLFIGFGILPWNSCANHYHSLFTEDYYYWISRKIHIDSETGLETLVGFSWHCLLQVSLCARVLFSLCYFKKDPEFFTLIKLYTCYSVIVLFFSWL
jgi:hypothetical protein